MRYTLRRAWPCRGGVTELVLTPHDLLRRLAALTPSRYTQLVRYHGVFARRAALRSRLPSPPVRVGEPCAAEDAASSTRRRRLPWAQLLMRVFSIAGLRCPRCSTPMVVLALISDPPVLATILSHLGLPAAPPATAIAPRGARRGRGPEGGRFAGELFVELDQPVGEAVDLGADAPWRDDAPIAPRNDDDRAPP